MSDTIFKHLTADELEKFQKLGFVGPFPLIALDEVDNLTKALSAESSKFKFLGRVLYVLSRVPGLKKLSELQWGEAKWHKGIHAISDRVYQIATESAILDKVASLIGENILLWASLILVVSPRKKPWWHTDSECREWDMLEGVSVWLALSNVDEQSCMRVITRTHNLQAIPEVLKKDGLDIYDDEALLAAAREFEPESECISVYTKPGEFFIFATRLWHTGSTGSKVRNSLLMQYCRPSTNARKPLTFDPPVVWDSCVVPRILVRGTIDDKIDGLVEPPPKMPTSRP
jgi:Phytanoyl-CoA dioxygenase (PhyH)